MIHFRRGQKEEALIRDENISCVFAQLEFALFIAHQIASPSKCFRNSSSMISLVGFSLRATIRSPRFRMIERDKTSEANEASMKKWARLSIDSIKKNLIALHLSFCDLFLRQRVFRKENRWRENKNQSSVSVKYRSAEGRSGKKACWDESGSQRNLNYVGEKNEKLWKTLLLI